VLPGMGCAAAPGSRGRGRRRPEPSSRGAERRRWPSARAASRGERTYWFWLEPGRDFFFHNLLVGLGLGYAKPYPCSPLATPVSVTHYHILFVNKSHRPSYLQICSTSDFEMWMEIDIHHIFFISTIHLCIERQFSSIPSMHGFLAFCFPTLSLEQSDPTFKNRRAVLELCSEGEQSKLQHSFN